jgi:hypothetical protein
LLARCSSDRYIISAITITLAASYIHTRVTPNTFLHIQEPSFWLRCCTLPFTDGLKNIGCRRASRLLSHHSPPSRLKHCTVRYPMRRSVRCEFSGVPLPMTYCFTDCAVSDHLSQLSTRLHSVGCAQFMRMESATFVKIRVSRQPVGPQHWALTT